MRLFSIRLALNIAIVTIAACNRTAPRAEQGTASVGATGITEARRGAAESIMGDYLRQQITKLSGVEFEGRGTASKGDELAMQYLEQQLKELGFQPAGPDGTYRQTFDLVGINAMPPKVWTFVYGNRKRPLKYWDEYIAGSGVQAPVSEIKNARVSICRLRDSGAGISVGRF